MDRRLGYLGLRLVDFDMNMLSLMRFFVSYLATLRYLFQSGAEPDSRWVCLEVKPRTKLVIALPLSSIQFDTEDACACLTAAGGLLP